MIRLLSYALEDRQQWLGAWEDSGREPFAHPDYVSLMSAPDEEPGALVWEGAPDGSRVLLPVIIRPLPSVVLESGDIAWRDAISPYGYGGPFPTGPHIDWAVFWQDVLAWMRTSQIVTFFVRSSLERTEQPPVMTGFNVVNLNKNVVVDLRPTPAEQWMNYAHKVRKNVNRARGAGMQFEIASTAIDSTELASIYDGTMARRKAHPRYIFDAKYFKALVSRLQSNCLIASVRDENGRMASAEVILRSDDTLYSFLGGTRVEYFPARPNDLLKHEVIGYGHAIGVSRFVLGGGMSLDDGIFRYKSTFSPLGQVDFQGYQLIGESRTYATLMSRFLQGRSGMQVDTRYFPGYRAPSPEGP